MSEQQAPRQLIVLCDGTNNNITGRRNDTNVVKLAELFARNHNPHRVVHYDPGVGNPGEMPGATVVDQWRRRAERVSGLAFGRGVYENIAEAYIFLMRHWRDQRDRIFVFGFSRGAFTARAVAGLINRFGLLRPDLEVLVPTLLHHYFSDRDAKDPAQREQWQAITEQIRRLFSNGPRIGADGQPNPHTRCVFVYYTGLWDTVASVGMWPFGLKITVRPRVEHKYFVHMRQALALDEQRAQFKQRLLLGENSDRIPIAEGLNGTLKQLWFRGAHCDVGGYYAPGETALPDQAMAWLVSEAVAVGLWIGPAAQVRNEGSAGGEQGIHEALLAAELTTPGQVPLVHSETFDTPLWALTGLAVRETQHVVMDDGTKDPITPVAHPSVAAYDHNPKAEREWSRPRPNKRTLLTALVACLLLPLYIGWVLDSCRGATDLGTTASCLLGNNWAFQMWQFEGSSILVDSRAWGEWTRQLAGFASPRWALVWDALFIVAYAWVLAWFATWAFARAAGLRQPEKPVPQALNVLGWALPLMVFADVVENLFGFIAIWAVAERLLILQTLGGVLAGLAAVASVAKYVGLAGVLVLILWGAASRRP